MLLVIFGAGASFDSSPLYEVQTDRRLYPAERDRPPLAKELFDPRYNEIVGKHDACQPLFHQLRGDDPIEETLERLANDAEKYLIINKRLLSLRYYIQEVIETTEDRWRAGPYGHQGITNYLHLLDVISRWQWDHQEGVCYVTFNYDRLLDRAYETNYLVDYLTEIDRYVQYPEHLLLKLHGSVNWRRRVNNVPGENLWARNDYPVIQEGRVIPHVSDLAWTDIYRVGGFIPPEAAYVPAIAVPTMTKFRFECPPDHIEKLKAALPQVSRAVAIGWRGMEKHFLDLWLHAGSKRLEKLLVVSGTDKEHKDIANRILTGIGANTTVQQEYSTRGFTKFLRESAAASRINWLLS